MKQPPYRITKNTMALLPVNDIQYQSRIIKRGGEHYATSSPFAIIKENCLHYGANYEGRKKSIQHHLAFQQKTPIPIHPNQNIFAFPTESVANYTCAWLFFDSITHIELISSQQTRIHFVNEETITFPISFYTLQKQYDRTGMCKVLFDTM